MGACCASSRDGLIEMEPSRRRLSLAHVEHKIGIKTVLREEDRSLLVELSQQTLETILKNDGRRSSWAVGSETDADQHRRQSFSQKTIVEMGQKISQKQGESTDVGYACKKGLKPEAPNQDSFLIIKIDQEISIYGVFDGHGPTGHDVSDFVKNELPKVLLREPELREDPSKALLAAYEKTQRLIEQASDLGKIQAHFSGTTCSIVVHLHDKNSIYVAHVGDSRCVLGRKQSKNENESLPNLAPKTQAAKANHLTGKHESAITPNVSGFEAVDLTQDHKPDDPLERERIENQGGRIVFDGFYNYRVYSKKGRYPGLNMSRALGDLAGYYEAGISPIPDVQCIPLSSRPDVDPANVADGDDKFLLLCSDGVWEFMSSQECVNICASFKADQAQECAEMLAKESWDRWNTHMMGQVVDDITAVVVFL